MLGSVLVCAYVCLLAFEKLLITNFHIAIFDEEDDGSVPYFFQDMTDKDRDDWFRGNRKLCGATKHASFQGFSENRAGSGRPSPDQERQRQSFQQLS